MTVCLSALVVIEQRRLAGYGHSLSQCADLQLQIGARSPISIDDDVLLLSRPEPLELRFHDIGAGTSRRN